jgi:epoxide hydrolase-like predicted phosphatase
MIKAIVFDIGGVLVRTEDHSGRQYLEKKYLLSPGGTDKLVFQSQASQDSTIGLKSVASVWAHVAKTLRLSDEQVQEFMQNFWQGDRLDHELIDYLISLGKDYQTALLSNAFKDSRTYLANEYNIIEGQTVDHLLISSELGVAKPDHKIFQILADVLQCDYTEILFVDDFKENIEAANELGIHTIWYQQGMDLINEIELKLK